MIKGEGPSIVRRILWFLAVTRVALLVFAIIDGRALGPTPRESMLLDFVTYARFFLAVPILVIAEIAVGPRLASAGLGFVRAGFVRREDVPAVAAAIDRVRRWPEALAPELIILGIAFFGAWYLSVDHGTGVAHRPGNPWHCQAAEYRCQESGSNSSPYRSCSSFFFDGFGG